MLQEKKIAIATRLKKTIDTSGAILREINERLERVAKDNESLVSLSSVFSTWVEKVERT